MSVEGNRFDRAVPVYLQPKSCRDATCVSPRPITRRSLRSLHDRSGVNGCLSVEVAGAGGARAASRWPLFPCFGRLGQAIDSEGPLKECDARNASYTRNHADEQPVLVSEFGAEGTDLEPGK